MSDISRRTAVKISAAGLMSAMLPMRAAVAAPLDGVEILAPAGPGGGYDQLARSVQHVLQARKLASSVQVKNAPGAGGTVGLAQFVIGKSRGASIMATGLGMIGAIVINKSPVTLDQVTPLARLIGEYQPLVVAASSDIKSLADLAAKFKANPGSVSWGGFALGSPDHFLSAMLVKSFSGDITKMNYVVSGAGGEMISQVMGNHITVATGGYNEFAGQIATGRLRALGISSPQRLPGVDVATFKELGFDVEFVNWRGLVTKSDIKPDQLKSLEEAIAAVVASDEWKTLLAGRGWVDSYLNAEQFKSFIATDQVRLVGLLKELGLAG